MTEDKDGLLRSTGKKGEIEPGSFDSIKNIWISKSVVSRFFLYCLLSIQANYSWAGGEYFVRQGNLLGVEIDKHLIKNGFCKNTNECFLLIPIYGGHGNGVNFTAYGVNEINKNALRQIVNFIVLQGIEITGGVPIKLIAYSNTHDDQVNKKMFQTFNPLLILEVRK